MSDDVHAVSVESYRGLRFRWSCSCGRRGRQWYQLRATAEQAGQAHETTRNAQTIQLRGA